MRRSSRGRLLLYSAIVLVGLVSGGVFAARGTGGAAAETESPTYALHRAADLSAPIVVSSADLDAERTSRPDLAPRPGEIAANFANATPALAAALAAHAVQFVKVHVYDTCAEDGDIVQIVTSTGATYGPFLLTHAGSDVSIPIVGLGAPRLTLRALKDGNGGITVGATTSTGAWYSGVIPEGGEQVVGMATR